MKSPMYTYRCARRAAAQLLNKQQLQNHSLAMHGVSGPIFENYGGNKKRLRNGSLRKRLRPKLAPATTTIMRCVIMASMMA
jgi:hypothetical protein